MYLVLYKKQDVGFRVYDSGARGSQSLSQFLLVLFCLFLEYDT